MHFRPASITANLEEVHHHGDAGNVGLGGDEIEERHHRGFRIEQALVHVDVDDLRAVLDLVARHLQRGGVVARGDQLAEFRRAGDVGALADIDEGNRGRQFERLQSRKPQARLDHGDGAGLVRRDGGGDRGDMVRRGAAAAADDVDEAGFRELADQPRHIFRALVVLAELVRQSGVRIGADQRIGDAADIGDMRPQILGAERAVETDGDRLGVPHRIPERFRQLARQQAAGFVGDGARDHHGHVDAAFTSDFGDGVERSLGVQSVEDGLDQQQIGATVEQAVDLFAVSLAQIVESHGAIAGIGYIRRDRRGAVGRAQRARNKSRLAVFSGYPLGSGAREFGAIAIELIGEVRHVVVGLRDRGRGEGVGRDDVGAGAQIIGVDIFDRLRLGQDQQIVVATDVAVKIRKTRATKRSLVILQALDHGAHGAVEHQNAFAGCRQQGGSLRRNLLGRRLCGHRIKRLSVRHWDGCPRDG